MAKKNIANIINEQAEKPVKRGVASVIVPQTQEKQQSYSVERPSRGYKIRLDYVYQYKLLAVKHHRKLYEEMEEALKEYLVNHRTEL